MSDRSGIEWCDASWNPVVGCRRVSEGCRHCYAERVAARMIASGVGHYQGTLDQAGRWAGVMGEAPERTWLQPLRWRQPRTIFVNSMGDLFHPAIRDELIDRAFGIMRFAHWHRFIVLTKRPERMRSYFSSREPYPTVSRWVEAAGQFVQGLPDSVRRSREWLIWDESLNTWPHENICLGVSVEDQRSADARIPELLATPAALRCVSYEPALGPVDFGPWIYEGERDLHWIICGGESGPGARPMHPDWALSVRDQCEEAGVAFFFKQWGKWLPCWGEGTHLVYQDGRVIEAGHEHPDAWKHQVAQPVRRVGKAAAGRELDGRAWDETPWENGTLDAAVAAYKGLEVMRDANS